jgi:hypothetical protein
MHAIRGADVPFALGGALAVGFYTGMDRPTKDLDLYIVPSDRERAMRAVTAAGLKDYFDRAPYDRRWIFRAIEGRTIVDIIWALANSRAQVDEDWLSHGPMVDLFDERMNLVPAEELIFSKLHVVQRERCDWPDVLNLLYVVGAHMDWDRLLARCAGEEKLLAAVLLTFSWIAPGRAEALPEWVWDRLEIPPPETGPFKDEERIASLDSRPWFVGSR